MTDIMARPKNSDLGIPTQEKRVPITMDQDFYRQIQEAASKEKLKVGPFIKRVVAQYLRDNQDDDT